MSFNAKEYARKHYLENKERYCLNAKIWRDSNVEKARKRSEEYRKKNHETLRRKKSEYYIKNRISVCAKAKADRDSNPEKFRLRKQKDFQVNKIARMKKSREYVSANKEKMRDYFRNYIRERCNNDVEFRITCRLRKRIWDALNGNSKSVRTKELIGCSTDFLRGYLEARFTLGMTWENYGDWHIDHRIPCAEFDLSKPEQQRQCFHYSNLQPLWAFDNISKNAKRPKTHQAELI